ncbi:MAG: HAMP domain-containing sensor histidine kinase [Nannocystaceae bacterium]
MSTEPTQAQPGDSAGALGIVLAAAATHFVTARVLLAAQGGIERAGALGRDALDLGVVCTGVALLCLLWLRARSHRAARLGRELPLLLVLTPPPTMLLAMWWSGDDTLGGRAMAPVLASGLGGACLAAVVAARGLQALTQRGALEGDAGLLPPRLSWSHAATAALAAATVALVGFAGATATRWPDTLQSLAGWAIAGGALLLTLAVVASCAAAASLTRDVDAVARRLEDLGHGSQPVSANAIITTEADELAQLLAELERLRARLDQEQRVYQDALERTQAADAAKAEFLSAVSHELRTPLHTVGGYAQLLLAGIPTPLTEAQADDVRLIQAGGRQLLELVNDILDLSMIESGDLRLSFAATDVSALVDEIVRIHRPLVREREVALRAELAELPDVVCDRRRIGQILTNLLSNAIKFTEHGSIVVKAEPLGSDRIEIAVADTGLGIAPEDLPLIFEEYQQAGTISRRKKGTGLGLAIARSIALAHGGTLSVSSRLGRGSTFTLVLPIDPPRRPTAIDIAEEAARAVVRARARGEAKEGA